MFRVADAESVVFDQEFDVIVFNDSLYCLPEPVSQFERYVQYLARGGTMLVSTYGLSDRASAVLRKITRMHPPIDQVTISRGEKYWTWTMFEA